MSKNIFRHQIMAFSGLVLLVAGCSSAKFGDSPGPSAQKTPKATNPQPEPEGVGGPSAVNVEDVPPQLLPMQFTRLPDTAANTNCLYVSINKGAEQLLGCNKGSSGNTGSTKFMVLPKPACNTVSLRMTTNGRQVWTTQNQSDISSYFQPPTVLGSGKIQIKCNDNGDRDFNDMNLEMDGLGKISFTIENSSVPCN